MSTDKRLTLVISIALYLGATAAATTADLPGLGKPVSEAELALWDMSIGPDGKGLPSGGGTAAQGGSIYAQKCEACHGKEGHGGTNAALINAPGKSDRTMALYVPNATTIFDFTRRAMPWPQPKSLTNDETYALTAFILAGNKIIGENETMNAETLPKVQMPNRNAFISRYPDKH
jgi:S-disulfanyl-L-cysteine oxidoreductase SoxD